MISLAKKLLGPGRASSSSIPVSESRVRKYSLTSAREQTSPISGTSFSLNPEHSFVTTDWSRISDDLWNNEVNPSETAESAVCSDTCDGTETKAFVMWSEISGRCGKGDVKPTDDCSIFSENDADVENSPVDARFSQDLGSRFDLRKQNLVELASESRPSFDALNSRSSCSTLSDFHDSRATISSDDFASVMSVELAKTVTKYQRIKKKRQSKDLKYRRKTVDNIDFKRSSPSDSITDSLMRFRSKSLTPSPIDDRPSYMNQWPKVPRRSSALRRRTVAGLFPNSEMFESRNEISECPSLLLDAVCQNSSSEDMLTDCSSVDMLGDGRHRLGRVGGAYGRRRRNLVAISIGINEMKQCKVIADLALLEDNTEFEPCRMPFEDTVVLWPTAVDKPSCFEYLGTSQSWISNLEAAGFVGVECIVMATGTFSQGSQDRALFLLLFPDHLLFAEQKSNSTLKLDRKIDVAQLWLSTRKVDVPEVAETDAISDGSRSFVIGWPPTNAVLTFATSEEKTIWTSKLEALIATKRSGDDSKELDIRVVYKERGLSKLKEFVVSSVENSFQFLQRCLQEFHLSGNFSKDYQLSVRWSKVHPEQPLLGHESPYLIEAWFMQCAARQRKENPHLQCLVLRERKRARHGLHDAGGRNRVSKPVALKTLFRKSQLRSPRPSPLFGLGLSEICTETSIPSRIQAMFQYLYVNAPLTVGVFRKSGRHKELNDFKSYLNSVEEIDFETVSVDVVASAIKDWLRNLPDCLLSCGLYNQWIGVSQLGDICLVRDELKRLSLTLDPSHLLVLRHLMCVLHRIQLHSKYNRMTSANLAVCIGPNVLHPGMVADAFDLQANSLVQANSIVRMLIESVEYVLGSDCVRLYQDLVDPYFIDVTEIDGDFDLNPNVSTEDISTQNCDHNGYNTSNSLESLSNDFTIENSTLTMSQSLDSMSPDSGLASSNPQLYEDILVTTNNSESNVRRSQRPQKDDLSKAELFDILEDQLVPDSDDASIGSEASDNYDSAQISVQMESARNANEDPLQQFQNSRINSEEIVGSFEERFSISEDHVSRSDTTERTMSVSSCSMLPEAEGAKCSPDDASSAPFLLGTESKDVPSSDLTTKKLDSDNRRLSKTVIALDDNAVKDTTAKPRSKTSQNYRLIGIEIVPILKSDDLSQTVNVQQTERRSMLIAVSPTVGRKVETTRVTRQQKDVDVMKTTAHDGDSLVKMERRPLLSRENPVVMQSQVTEQRLLDSEKDITSTPVVPMSRNREVNFFSDRTSVSSSDRSGPGHLARDARQHSGENDAALSVLTTKGRQKICDKEKYVNVPQVVEEVDASRRTLGASLQPRNHHELQNTFLNTKVTIIPGTAVTDIRRNGQYNRTTKQIEGASNQMKKSTISSAANTYCKDGDITVTGLTYREEVGPVAWFKETGLKNHFRKSRSSSTGTNVDGNPRIVRCGEDCTNTAVIHAANSKHLNLNTQTAASRSHGISQRSGLNVENRSACPVRMPRRTTVIQLGDHDSVILQKTVKRS